MPEGVAGAALLSIEERAPRGTKQARVARQGEQHRARTGPQEASEFAHGWRFAPGGCGARMSGLSVGFQKGQVSFLSTMLKKFGRVDRKM